MIRGIGCYECLSWCCYRDQIEAEVTEVRLFVLLAHGSDADNIAKCRWIDKRVLTIVASRSDTNHTFTCGVIHCAHERVGHFWQPEAHVYHTGPVIGREVNCPDDV